MSLHRTWSETQIVGFLMHRLISNILELTLCGPLQDNLSGMLTSSNRDLTDSYDEVSCSWKIIVQPYKKKIQLYVLETVFQSSNSCLQAFVKVYQNLIFETKKNFFYFLFFLFFFYLIYLFIFFLHEKRYK